MGVIPNGFTYLDFPLFWGKTVYGMVQPILHQVEKKIESWKRSQTSLAGCSDLTQIVSNLLANYLMSRYNIPKKTFKEINLHQARFWWGNTGNRFWRLLA